MRKLIAVLVMVAFVALAFYLGAIWGLVGGIVTIVHGAQHSPVQTTTIIWGAFRVLFCEFLFAAPICFGIYFAQFLWENPKPSVGGNRKIESQWKEVQRSAGWKP